tara:strand:- start:580 stop:819 length:240 start_codon:yes stop_codon:yes gene_type:complete
VNERSDKMTTVNINEVDYDTDDFTEDQKTLYNEIMYATNVVNNLTYQMQCVKTMQASVANKLSKSLQDKGDDDNGKSEE